MAFFSHAGIRQPILLYRLALLLFPLSGGKMNLVKLTSSPKLNYLLGEMGIFTPFEVINHLPRRYDSFCYATREELMSLAPNRRYVLFGKILTPIQVTRFSKISAAKFYLRDQYGDDYAMVAYNRPYLGKTFKEGDDVSVAASFDSKRHELSVISIKKGRIDAAHQLVPVYSLPADYPNHSFASLVKKSLEALKGQIYDHVPSVFAQKYRLIHREEAYWKCHFPASPADLNAGRRVLKYEEALTFTLHNLLIKRANKALIKGDRFALDQGKIDSFIAKLPFVLTADQKKAVDECLSDMGGGTIMTRLLQGDVGTGKTLVAAILAYANFTRGEQTAIMAPTESLAKQHLGYFSALLEPFGVKVGYLTGLIKGKERKAVLSALSDGSLDVLIGTHALFGADVLYPNLGLAIIDEQHKFGVNQRSRLLGKGERADLLLMSATPIPRTLSLTLYGDLDVSSLALFPFKKREVETKIVPANYKRAALTIAKALQEERQVYVIAPRVEGEGDESVQAVYEKISGFFPGLCALIHGQLDEESKEKALEEFKSGKKPILVATSIVEVGIDVKKAGMMFVFSPTSFSLSSLHQLRGRIGRDGQKAHFYMCISAPSEEDKEKLGVLVDSSDGFEIAEADLRLRGPGTLSGTRQSGFPEFSFLSPVNDLKIFECARADAAYIIDHQGEKQFLYLLSKAKEAIEGASLA